MKRFPISEKLQQFLREHHECENITDMREYLSEELQECIEHGYVSEMWFIDFSLDDGELMTEICDITAILMKQ